MKISARNVLKGAVTEAGKEATTARAANESANLVFGAMTPLLAVLLSAALFGAAFARAEESSGCDKFKWPLAHERSALLAPTARLETGARLTFDAAASIHLAPLAEAKLEMAPERPPKFSPSYAGAVKLDAPSAAGTFKVSLSDGAWIDVVQDGRFVKPAAVSSAPDCAGLRRSVKFPLAAKPLTIQLSDVKSPDISIIVSPE
jgi:hypothetical protein